MICERDAAFEGHIGCSLAQTRGRESRIQRSAKDGFSSRFMHLCDRKGFSGSAFIANRRPAPPPAESLVYSPPRFFSQGQEGFSGQSIYSFSVSVGLTRGFW